MSCRWAAHGQVDSSKGAWSLGLLARFVAAVASSVCLSLSDQGLQGRVSMNTVFTLERCLICIHSDWLLTWPDLLPMPHRLPHTPAPCSCCLRFCFHVCHPTQFTWSWAREVGAGRHVMKLPDPTAAAAAAGVLPGQQQQQPAGVLLQQQPPHATIAHILDTLVTSYGHMQVGHRVCRGHRCPGSSVA